MFDIASSEVVVLGVVALLVIPPKDLPKAMRFAGHWMGKVRGVANQFRSGFDTMVREAELQDMEKKWAAENERIMREHPPGPAQMLPMAGPPGQAYPGEAYPGAGAEETAPVMVEAPVLAPPPTEAPVDAASATEPKAESKAKTKAKS